MSILMNYSENDKLKLLKEYRKELFHYLNCGISRQLKEAIIDTELNINPLQSTVNKETYNPITIRDFILKELSTQPSIPSDIKESFLAEEIYKNKISTLVKKTQNNAYEKLLNDKEDAPIEEIFNAIETQNEKRFRQILLEGPSIFEPKTLSEIHSYLKALTPPSLQKSLSKVEMYKTALAIDKKIPSILTKINLLGHPQNQDIYKKVFPNFFKRILNWFENEILETRNAVWGGDIYSLACLLEQDKNSEKAKLISTLAQYVDFHEQNTKKYVKLATELTKINPKLFLKLIDVTSALTEPQTMLSLLNSYYKNVEIPDTATLEKILSKCNFSQHHLIDTFEAALKNNNFSAADSILKSGLNVLNIEKNPFEAVFDSLSPVCVDKIFSILSGNSHPHTKEWLSSALQNEATKINFNPNTIIQLLVLGANPNIPTAPNHSSNSLQNASIAQILFNATLETPENQQMREIMKLLIEKNANIEPTKLITALNEAIKIGDFSLVDVIVQKNRNIVSEISENPLITLKNCTDSNYDKLLNIISPNTNFQNWINEGISFEIQKPQELQWKRIVSLVNNGALVDIIPNNQSLTTGQLIFLAASAEDKLYLLKGLIDRNVDITPILSQSFDNSSISKSLRVFKYLETLGASYTTLNVNPLTWIDNENFTESLLKCTQKDTPLTWFIEAISDKMLKLYEPNTNQIKQIQTVMEKILANSKLSSKESINISAQIEKNREAILELLIKAHQAGNIRLNTAEWFMDKVLSSHQAIKEDFKYWILNNSTRKIWRDKFISYKSFETFQTLKLQSPNNFNTQFKDVY